MLTPRQLVRLRRRGRMVITNSLNNLAIPLFSLLVSWLVIRRESVERWGELVAVMIVTQLAAHVMHWGHKEYLLRAFSLNPTKIVSSWHTALSTRLLLFIPYLPVLFLFNWSGGRIAAAFLWTLFLVLSQSVEVLVVYRRAFGVALLVEVGHYLLLLGGIALWPGTLTVDRLIGLFTLVAAAKTAGLWWFFRKVTLKGWSRPQFPYFAHAFTFFLIGFSGTLNSRIDLYSVSYFLTPGEVGQYQILINLLLYVQALSNFILLPFAKGLYRLDLAVILKVALRLLSVGLLVTPPALFVIHLLLRILYNISLPWIYWLVGGAYVLPIYFYAPVVYALFKANRQKVVIQASLFGALLNVLLNLWLIPNLGILGALLATTLSQWFNLPIYLLAAHRIESKIVYNTAVNPSPGEKR